LRSRDDRIHRARRHPSGDESREYGKRHDRGFKSEKKSPAVVFRRRMPVSFEAAFLDDIQMTMRWKQTAWARRMLAEQPGHLENVFR